MSSILKGLNENYSRDEQDQQNAMDTRRSTDLSRERNAGLNEPDEYSSEPIQTRNGVYEYNVPAGQEDIAKDLGLQHHRGHWVSRIPIQRANFQFGRPQFHEIPAKGMAEGSKEQEYGPEWDDKVKRLGQMAKQGERKTVWDPVKRVYKTVPVQQSSIKEGIDELDENLNKWFKEKWVRFGPDGKIRGDCARGDDSEGKPKCLPQSKAQSLGKKGRASAAARKRREDPNPERSGKAINVATKKKSNEGMAEGYNDLGPEYGGAYVNGRSDDAKMTARLTRQAKAAAAKAGKTFGTSAEYRKWHARQKEKEGVAEAINPDITNPEFSHQQQIGDYLYVARYWSKGLKITAYHGNKQIGYAELMYQSAPFDDFADPKTTPKRIWLESEWTKVDPKYQRQGIMSTMYAYAKMLGNSVKPSQTRSDDAKAAWKSWRDAGDAQHLTREGVAEQELDEACWKGYHKEGNKKMFGKTYPNCVKNTNEELDIEEGRENYNGLNILLQKDDEELFVKASAGGRELGHVLFVIDNGYLMPQDLEVEERFRGQGIAQTMYDYVKSKGYKIRRSGQQTDAGAGFWDKHRPEQNVWEEHHSETCPHCGGEMVSEELMNEKKDACYYKVKSRYKVWPSAYASGALVQCRKKGADSWGNGGKKNEGVAEEVNPEVTSDDYTEPSQNVRMGDFVFNARTFTGALGEPNAKGLQIRAYEPKNLKSSIGSADFIVKKDKKGNQWLESDDTEVNDEYRGKGVATMMYAFAKSLGNDIKDSPYKSKAGSDMWKKWGSDAKHLVGEQGVAEDQLDEKWTKKYKDSINCSDPKGFSQKAHCAGKKKSESAIMKGLVDETLGTPYPGTYEQEMEPFKRKGQQQRVQKIAFEGKK